MASKHKREMPATMFDNGGMNIKESDEGILRWLSKEKEVDY